MPRDHLVKQGECIISIAQTNGLFWETLWNDPGNSELRQLRGDPNVLMPGDVLRIPDRQLRQENCATESRHRFRARGTPAKLRLRLTRRPQEEETPVEQVSGESGEFIEQEPEQQEPEAEANAPFVLYVDGELIGEDETDEDGRLEVVIPPASMSARLVLYPGANNERTVEIELGRMDPKDELPGVCKRLRNLGYDCPTDSEDLTPQIRQALQTFQRRHDLEVNGEPDEQTRSKLKELHGG